MPAKHQSKIEQALALLRESRHAVALTGAGISTPSGIPDFRSPDSGLWKEANPMEVASLFAFQQRPEAFYDWVRPLVKISQDAAPNAAHYALRVLEEHGPLKTIITQNIDLLHTQAGSRSVLEVHGHMREMICVRCGTITEAAPYLAQFVEAGILPRCRTCQAIIKPRMILYGEILPRQVIHRAEAAAVDCDLMLIAGTSLEVLPVNKLPRLAHRTGARLIIVNLGPTPLDELAEVVIRSDVTEVLPRLAEPFRHRDS